MPYRYETHLHTAEGSKCATASGAEMARAHREKGYTGINTYYIPCNKSY